MFTRYQNYFFILPVLAVTLSLGAIIVYGFRPGIDLVGGSLLQVSFPAGRPEIEAVRAALAPLPYGQILVQPTADEDYLLRARTLSPEEKDALGARLSVLSEVEEVQFNSVGPSIGEELLRKAWVAMALVIFATIAFLAFAFRTVSRPVASWKYGVVAIVTLLHDILIPIGLFAYLGATRGAEVDALFIVALLTILGISVNDTIVVFDRIRENLRRNREQNRHEEFDEVVGRSVRQTVVRSVNTSVTVIIVLLALFFLGPVSTKDFALTLTVGMIVGTYSSIFLAAPLLVLWERWGRKKVNPA